MDRSFGSASNSQGKADSTGGALSSSRKEYGLGMQIEPWSSKCSQHFCNIDFGA